MTTPTSEISANKKNSTDPNQGYQLNLVEYPKDAPKLVFLHGLGGTHRYWLQGLEQLKQHFHIILVDLLGFGDSDKPWINYRTAIHLGALRKRLVQFDHFILVGHSLGAALALSYAATYPGQVTAQILISLPFFSSQERAYQWMRRTPTGWLMTNLLAAVLTCLFTRRVIGKYLPRILKEFPTEVAEDLLKHNVFSSTTSLWQVLYHSTIRKDAARLDQSIKTLVIHALDDDTAPYQPLKKLTEQNDQWQLLSLEQSSHHPWLWQNQVCQNAILSFIENDSCVSQVSDSD